MFQFTHPVRGATPLGDSVNDLIVGVSIHAPREGCDRSVRICPGSTSVFQFTHPVRGATLSTLPMTSRISRFNSRTP